MPEKACHHETGEDAQEERTQIGQVGCRADKAAWMARLRPDPNIRAGNCKQSMRVMISTSAGGRLSSFWGFMVSPWLGDHKDTSNSPLWIKSWFFQKIRHIKPRYGKTNGQPIYNGYSSNEHHPEAQWHPRNMEPDGNTAGEDWADIFLNWTFGTFAPGLAGDALNNWTTTHMAGWISEASK